MTKSQLSEKDLLREIDDLRDRYARLRDDDLFLLWFLRAYLTEGEDTAVASLTGGSGDKGIDAVLIDDSARVVFLVQGKYRRRIGRASESRSDVLSLAQLGATVTNSDHAIFTNLVSGMADDAAERIREARNRIIRSHYRLHLYFVTTGKVSKSLREEAARTARSADPPATLDVVDHRHILLLLSDYLDGVAPPIPSLELAMESGYGIRVNAVHQRFDSNTKIESWVFSMNSDGVAELYENAGRRIFARNVRGFLGNTAINTAMAATLRKEPEYFWYYNNGITIICDGAEKISRQGRDFLRVNNPQIINGQQTTRTLHAHPSEGRGASVLVRVIHVPRDTLPGESDFESLVSNIVGATNWQNAIRPSDLRSNDRRQIEIERELRKFRYQYLRKRETKGEARRRAASKHKWMLSKEQLAQAVAGCTLEPAVLRLGKERLFEEALYDQVFPNSEPTFYLPRYWLMRQVEYEARGYPERAYAKWLVLRFLWARTGALFRSRSDAARFCHICERDLWELSALLAAINHVYRAALRFYRVKRGTGARGIDVSSFFRRRGLLREFEAFWRRAAIYRVPFVQHYERFQKGFKEAQV
jgi:hypothetical protein